MRKQWIPGSLFPPAPALEPGDEAKEATASSKNFSNIKELEGSMAKLAKKIKDSGLISTAFHKLNIILFILLCKSKVISPSSVNKISKNWCSSSKCGYDDSSLGN